MKRLTTILALIVGLTIGYANDTESKLQNNLDRRAKKLTTAIRKFDTMRKALATSQGTEREAALRLLCRRMKAETAALDNTIDSLDVYLQIQQFNKKDDVELNRTKQNITTIKSEIEALERSLGKVSGKNEQLAAK